MQEPAYRPIQNHSSRGQNYKLLSFFNVFRLNRGMFLLFLFWLGVLALAGAAQAEVKKLSSEEDVLAAFESEQQKIKVIIGLEMPQHLKSIKSFKNKQFKAQVRTEIASRQSSVLSGLSANEFVLSHRYKNFECFAGEVTLQGLDKLLAHPLVRSIELSRLEHKMLAQGIALINAITPRSTYNGQNVAIAISDTGVDYTHPRLGGGGFPNSKVIGGYDTGDNDSNPAPNGEAHGTACAGIAAGDLGTVGDYIGGVAHNAKIYAMKISFGSGGSAYDTDTMQAWDWCIDHQYDNIDNPILIVSHSFGGGRYFSATEAENDRPSYASAAGRLVAAGITIFAASGNEGYCESMAAPAAFSDVISIGAVYDTGLGTIGFCVEPESCAAVSEAQCSPPWACWDTSAADMVCCYSNSAAFLDLLAPAHDAYTTDISGSGGYEAGDYTPDFGGTSAACPYAAGAAACIQQAAKDITGSFLSPAQIRDILINTGDPVTDTKVAITKPRINLGDAIGSLVPVVCCPTTISSFPYSEDFEGEATCGVTCGTPCPLSGDWTNDDADDHDWTVDSGGTTSGSTGPSVDHNPGTSGGKYLYTESSSSCNNSEAILLGPCFDLSSLSNPQLRFWHHMYGATMGDMTVELSDDNCVSWAPVWTLSGDQGNAWYEAVVDLSAYAGSTIKIRFNGLTGSSFTSDMAIDDIHIEDVVPQPPSVVDVNVSTSLDTAVTITLEASDDGYPDPPGILTYIVTSLPNDGTLSDPCDGAITDPCTPLVNYGNQVVYTPDSGYFGLDEFTFKANDGGTEPNGGDSNTATITIDVQLLPVVIYEIDFESGLDGWIIDNSFGDGSGLWHLTTSCNSTLSGHTTPTSLYYGQDISCNYDAGQTEGVVMSPTISLASVDAPIELSFKYYLQTEGAAPSYDIATVEISENGGAFSTVAGNSDGSLSDPSGGWLPKAIDISSMAGSDIEIRFTFRTVDSSFNTYPGFYIDDVEILGICDILGDFQMDCQVSLHDLAILASAWLSSPGQLNWNPNCDISDPSDNIINEFDLAVFVENWLKCLGPMCD